MKDQLEFSIAYRMPNRAGSMRRRKRMPLERARWWFDQMRKAVEDSGCGVPEQKYRGDARLLDRWS
jgi:hypothetical protein